MPKKLVSLQELLLDEMKDLYDAEHRITKALPKLAKKATSPELADAFTTHLKQTEGHIKRLEKAFSLLGEKAKRKTCKAMKGLMEEGEEVLKEPMENHVKDAALIASAQRVEHYEMAGYGCVRTFASLLGHSDVADLLQQTLDEEGETDHLLTRIAESTINPAAA